MQQAEGHVQPAVHCVKELTPRTGAGAITKGQLMSVNLSFRTALIAMSGSPSKVSIARARPVSNERGQTRRGQYRQRSVSDTTFRSKAKTGMLESTSKI
jgi:hypothetical protein